VIAALQLALSLVAVMAACSAPPGTNSTTQVPAAAHCADVRKEYAQAHARVAQRVRELRAQDEEETRAGKTQLERNSKFIAFRNELEELENRYAVQLAGCPGTNDAQN
jgi:uncharacterized protein involved in exopolysaccharide biosynthesis